MRVLLAAPLLFILVLFALSNKQAVDLGLWPTDIQIELPVSLAVLGIAGLFFLFGALGRLERHAVGAVSRQARRGEDPSARGSTGHGPCQPCRPGCPSRGGAEPVAAQLSAMARVKICGINTPEAFAAAQGADWVGFNFYPPSPRFVTPSQAAALSGGPIRVGLFVAPSDDELDATLAVAPLDILQLYVDPARAIEIRRRVARPVWRAVGVGSRADLPTDDEDIDGYRHRGQGAARCGAARRQRPSVRLDAAGGLDRAETVAPRGWLECG